MTADGARRGRGRTAARGRQAHDTSGWEPRLLAVYLNDHLASSSAGVDLARRVAAAQAGTQAGRTLGNLAQELSEDRDALVELMRSIDAPVRSYKVVAARVAERAGRLKLNGRLVRRSPLSPLVELEALGLVVEHTGLAWRALRVAAEAETRLDWQRLDGLVTRAQRQRETVDRVRTTATNTLFGAR